MFQINRTLVLAAAAIAVGLVAVIEVAQSRQPSAAASVAARFPAPSEMFVTYQSPAGKSDRGEGESCTREHWPYIADECLNPADKGQARQPRRPVRTITIERRIADASGLAGAQVAIR